MFSNPQFLILENISATTTVKDFYKLVSGRWHNFDINDPGRNGHSLLQVACIRGNVDLARLFIKIGARVNHPRIDKRTALYDAINMGNLELVKLLVENHASIHMYCGHGNSIEWATKCGHTAIVDYLQDVSKELDYQPFITAAEIEAREKKVNVVNFPQPQPQLLEAIEKNDVEVVEHFVSERNVDLNTSSLRDMRPILVNVGEAGHFDMVKLLVKHGIIICESYMQYTDNGRKLISVIESLKQSGKDDIAAYLENEHNRRYEVLQKELNMECESKANESTSLTSCRS